MPVRENAGVSSNWGADMCGTDHTACRGSPTFGWDQPSVRSGDPRTLSSTGGCMWSEGNLIDDER